MASNEDRISKHTVGRSTAQMSFAEFSAASAPPPVPSHGGDKEETVQVPVSTKEKRGFDIDLNVALSEEQDFSNSNENGCEIVEEEKSTVIVDPDEEREERNRRWEALLDVAEIKLCEYNEEHREKAQGKSPTRKKRGTRGVDELGSGSTRKKSTSGRNYCTFEDYSDDCVVVRSTRGRAVAMPNKYRDSVLEPAAELPRVNRTGKAVAAKRKSSRLPRDSK